MKNFVIMIIAVILSIFSYLYCNREADYYKAIAHTRRSAIYDHAEISAFNYEYGISNRGKYEAGRLSDEQSLRGVEKDENKSDTYKTASVLLPVLFITIACILIYSKRKKQ